MRFFVAGAIYRASGALFRTMDTVAGENPLCVATSRIVTASFLPLDLFTGRGASADIIILPESLNLQSLLHRQSSYSGGASKDSVSLNPRVFQTPNAIPAIIHMLPTIIAGRLRFTHKPRQIRNPSTGGIKFHSFFCSARTK